MADFSFINKLLNERYEALAIINTKRPSAYDSRENNLSLFEKPETRLNKTNEQFRIPACIMSRRPIILSSFDTSNFSRQISTVESIESKNNVESSQTTNVEFMSKLFRISVELFLFVSD